MEQIFFRVPVGAGASHIHFSYCKGTTFFEIGIMSCLNWLSRYLLDNSKSVITFQVLKKNKMVFCKNKSAFWSDKTPFYFVKTAIYFAKNIDFFRAFSGEKIAFVSSWFSNRSFLHKKIAVFFQKIFVFFEKIGVFLVRKRRFFRAYQKVGFLSAKISKKTRVKTAKKSEEK